MLHQVQHKRIMYAQVRGRREKPEAAAMTNSTAILVV
jgi:hypothetical protein